LVIWSFFQPYPALISGLVYYILLILLFAILDPMTIFGGIIWKILVIAFLVYSIKIAKNERSASQSNEILDQV
jgi:4-hydroxybenzoate polyprenyltransferase